MVLGRFRCRTRKLCLQEALVRGAFKVIIGSTVLVLFMHALSSAFAQPAPNSPPFLDETHQAAISEETANILGLSPLLDQLRALRSQRECGSAETLEELRLRQTLLEAVEAASLDVDGVLAEIVNERTDLSELRSSLEIRVTTPLASQTLSTSSRAPDSVSQ